MVLSNITSVVRNLFHFKVSVKFLSLSICSVFNEQKRTYNDGHVKIEIKKVTLC